MEIRFEDSSLQELYEYGTTKDKRYTKYCKNGKFVRKLIGQINTVRSAETYLELEKISTLHYERLRHGMSGLSSFRVGNAYVERVICRENDERIEIIIIELDDTHYGNKK